MLKAVADLLVAKSCFGCGSDCSDVFCDKCLSSISLIKQPICAKCGYPTLVKVDSCRQCRHKHYKFIEGRSLLTYEGAAKEALVKIKSQSAFALVDFFVKKAIEDYESDFFNVEGVTFIPTTWAKKLNRRHNVSEIMARCIAHHKRIDCVDMLKIGRKVKDQVSLDKKERQNNLKGAFKLRNGVKRSSRIILVVDDIFTTGATLNEACNVLYRGEIKTKVFTLARRVT